MPESVRSFVKKLRVRTAVAKTERFRTACARASWQSSLHVWAQQQCPVTATTAISACGRAHRWEISLEIYRILENDKGKPGKLQKKRSLDAAAHSGYRLKKLRFDQDPAPLNATIATVANATYWSLALELLEYGHRYGRAFDLWGWNAAIHACGCAGKWRAALALLEELHSLRLADATSVNSVISACDRSAHWQGAIALLDWQADLVGVSTAISACARGAKWAHALSALQIHAANEVTFSAAITACGRSTRWHTALKLLGEALSVGRASLTCFAAAVSACELGAAWQVALSLVGLAARDWRLDRVMINAAVSSCEKGWQWERCLGLPQGSVPDAVTFGAAAEACNSAMRWMEALSLATQSMESSHSPVAFFAAAAGTGFLGRDPDSGSCDILGERLQFADAMPNPTGCRGHGRRRA
eukprot:s644_g29.t2